MKYISWLWDFRERRVEWRNLGYGAALGAAAVLGVMFATSAVAGCHKAASQGVALVLVCLIGKWLHTLLPQNPCPSCPCCKKR